MKRLATVVLLLVLAAPVFGQQVQIIEVKDLISGKLFPLTMQLKDLSSDWMHVTVGGQAESANPLQMYAAMFGGEAASAYYTKGQTAAVQGETFLIAYRVQTKPLDMMTLMRGGSQPPPPEALTPESTLALSLLNLRAILSLNDIRPFNLEQEIAASKAAAQEATEEEETWVEQPEGAGMASATDRLKQATLAALMYTQDHGDELPPMQSADAVKEALLPYVRNADIFIDPETKQPFKANAVLSGKKIAHIQYPAETVLFYEEKPNAEGMRAAAFVDGHTARVGDAEWQRIKKLSKIP